MNEHNFDRLMLLNQIVGYYMFRTFDGYARIIKDVITFRNH